MQEGFPNKDEHESNVLTQELLHMFDRDQTMRMSETWDPDVDKTHTERMKEIVKASGWPTISQVGEQAAHAAWLLVQHADIDPQFQAEALASMKALPENEVAKSDIAFLEDRVRVNMGEPTLFGTQFYYDEQGVFGPRPIEDLASLDERRAAMGLGSFEEYEKKIRNANKGRQKQA